MTKDRYLPTIETVFGSHADNPNSVLYHDAIPNALKKILPEEMTFNLAEDIDLLDEQRAQFHSLLPFVTHSKIDSIPTNISFFALSKYRPNSFKFFFDMVSRWLVPGKRLNVVMIYAADFRMPEFNEGTYTICEVMIRIESQTEYIQIMHNWPIIETELRLGIQSSYYARRIMEIKGLSADEKTALIQEHIAYLVTRLPKFFDYDVLTEMQHVLVMCRDDFKAARESPHLSRIISIHYLFRKNIRESLKIAPQKRHLHLKLFRTRIRVGGEEKRVLGLIVGVNFLREKEVLETTHILKAIQNFIPEARAVENSFFFNKRGNEYICTLYIEVEKSNGEEFSIQEMNLLRKILPNDLKDRIEHLMQPLFMPSNEEEIIRNILSLSSQIKYIRDIPQVFISFHEQTHSNLFFTIILVRLLRSDDLSIQELFNRTETFLEYIHDRCQNAGNLRRKYKKEATVFRVKLSKEQFLRADHSIDLNKARQAVVTELGRVVGEVRDYNGGMISKQNEVLCEVQNLLNNNVNYNALLLENFFYSLTPVIMRTLLEPQVLEKLFLMMLESMAIPLSNGEAYRLNIESDDRFAYVMLKVEDHSIRENLSLAIVKMQLHSSELAHSYISEYEDTYLGFVYRCNENAKKKHFCKTIQSVIESWEQSHQKVS